MKTIYSMGKGKYVTLDSYPATHETRPGDFITFLLASAIMAVTIGAAMGVDITNIKLWSNQTQQQTIR